MKRKNLSLKLAALLLACGGFGAVSGFANSVYAMDSSDGFNSSEEKKQNEISTSLVPAITIDDINNHYSDLKLERNLSETPDRYLNFFREYVINEHLGKDPKVAKNLKSGVLDFAKTFYHDYLGEYHAYLEKIKAGFEQKLTDLNTNSVSAPINSINNEPSGDMLPANINDASDKQIQKFIQFLAYKQNIGGLDDFVGYDFKEVAKRYYDEYAAKYNEYVKKNKTGVEPKKINSISTTKTKIKIPEFLNFDYLENDDFYSFFGSYIFSDYYKIFDENGGITESNFKKAHFEQTREWPLLFYRVENQLAEKGYTVKTCDPKYSHFSGFADEEVRALYDHPLFGKFMERLCKNCGLYDLLKTMDQTLDYVQNYFSFRGFDALEIEQFGSFNIENSGVTKIVELPKKIKEYAEKMQKEYGKFLKDRSKYGADFETVKKVFRLAVIEQLELVRGLICYMNLCTLYDCYGEFSKYSGDDAFSLIPRIYDRIGLYDEDLKRDRDIIKDFMRSYDPFLFESEDEHTSR